MKTLEQSYNDGCLDGRENAIQYALSQKKTRGTMGPMPTPQHGHLNCNEYHYQLGFADGFNDVRNRLNPYLEAKLLAA